MKKILILLLLISSTAWAKRVPVEPESVLLYNASANKTVIESNADQVRAIASITKIMTAMVTLDWDKDLSRKLMLSKRVGSHLPRQEYTRLQLLEAMLIKSDNAAAETIAEDYPGGRTAFIEKMNWYAKEWELPKTKFEDPSGLGKQNLSTARDVANMMHIASGYWLITDISTKKQIALETKYKKKIRTIKLEHTSGNILFTFDNILVSKTGLTNAAKWCVGLVTEQNKQQYVIVVLGSPNKSERLKTVKDIMYNHVLDQNLQRTK